MNFHLSTPARLGVALAFAFFVLSLPYNFYHAPTLDLKPPHVASNRVSREILEAAGHAHQKGKDSNEAVNLNLGGKGPKGNEVNSNIGINSDATDGTAPFDMFAESISLMGRDEHEERLVHLIGGTLPGWKIPLKDDGGCHHTLERDYAEHPIIISNGEPDVLKTCNIPCTTPGAHGKAVPIDIMGGSGGSKGTSCTRRLQFSMENSHFFSDSRNTFDGTPQLTSTIPIQYMDWNAFRFWDYVKTKTKNAAAFISNCSFKKRNALVTDLQKYGVDVQSYGGCMNNAREPGGGRQKTKLLRSYRFSLAFENSETPDYITEKFFDALMAGAVPVYLGANNVRLFAPSDHSFIDVNDFESTKALAEHLLYLEKNDTAYREYLQWKIDGYSDDFQALVDMSCYHSLCRSCLLAADMLRLDYGSSVYDAPLSVHTQPKLNVATSATPSPLTVRLRERGSYRFVDVTLYDKSLAYLVDAALRYVEEHHKERWGNDREAFTFTWDKLEDDDDTPYPPKKKQRSRVIADHRKKVYGLYTVGYRTPLLRDADVAELTDGAEVEVIFV